MDGALAGYAIWASSCTMHMSDSNIVTLGWQWLQQQLGFHDSPGMGKNSLRRWRDDLKYRNNAAAWLEKMQYSDQGYRVWSPVAMSFGPPDNWCWAVFDNANLKNGTYRYPQGGGPECGATEQPFFWYCWEMRNQQEECG
jgi:hypothetical protein